MYTLAPHRNNSQTFMSDSSRSPQNPGYPLDPVSSAAQVPRDSPFFLPDHHSYLPSPSLDLDVNYSDRRDNILSRDPYARSRSYSDTSDPSSSLSGPSSGLPHHQYRPRHYQVSSHAHGDDIQYSSVRQNDLSHPILPSLSRREDHPNAVMETPSLVSNIRYPPEASPMTASPSMRSSAGEPTSWPALPKDSPTEPVPPRRKPRREKPRIELAPDQPPTTQGKPRARVYVACVQCRNRKIRCDGAKPVCHNCNHRSTGSGGECTYDAAPKRRGPDKTPGARQRMARDVRNEIDNVGVPTRRRRRRRDTEESKSESSVPDRMRSQSTSDIGSQSGGQSSSLWPLSLPMASDVTQSPESYISPVHNVSQDKSTEYANCGCAGSSVYGHTHSFIGRHDQGDMSRHSPHCASYDAYLPGFETQSSYAPCSTSVPGGFLPTPNDEYKEEQEAMVNMVSEPSLDFNRKNWWDSLLSLYSSTSSRHVLPLTNSQRELISKNIISDLRFVFQTSNYWFSFFHIPYFFGNFYDPAKRQNIQPALVLALIAVSTFWQSSEIGYGREGRERALTFRDEAQGALEASFNARWIDETLAQAAWVLALFEVCAHPKHSSERSGSAMVMLDSIIRSLSLAFLDSSDHDTSVFSPRSVPNITSDQSSNAWSPHSAFDPIQTSFVIPTSTFPHSIPERDISPGSQNIGCACKSMSLGAQWPGAMEHAPLWATTAGWSGETEAEIRKESCRRLCWSSMVLAAGHISYTTTRQAYGLDLFVSDPANYALLFSGESITRSGLAPSSGSFGRVAKDTVWALYDRSMLLWHSCMRIRHDPITSDADKAQFAKNAWLEADAIEDALTKHTCDVEKSFIYQGREYLFNTRMCITYEFSRFIPYPLSEVNSLFNRTKAEEWLRHQATVAQRYMYDLSHVNRSHLARRPFFVFWFMGQVSRALTLWECDNTLTVALDVCKAFLSPIEYLTALWPCTEQRTRYNDLRERLSRACMMTGASPLPPLNLSLPQSSSPEMT